MTLPLVVLAALSVFGGFLLEQNHAFERWLYPKELPVLGAISVEPTGLPLSLGIISLIAALLGILAGVFYYRNGLPKSEGWDESSWSGFRRRSYNQFGYDALMTSAAVEGGNELANTIGTGLERSVVDGAVNGSGLLAGLLGRGLGVLQKGFIRSYALMMLIGGVVIVGYFAFIANGGAH